MPPEVKAAIAASVKASNSPTADDKKGGFHEEGGVWGTDIKSGEVIVSPAKPGPVSNPGDKTAHLDVGNAVNPALNQQMMPQGEWHIHPKGSGDRQFVQPPSGADKTNAVFKTNIVMGAGNNRVYFYNSSGVVRETSLKHRPPKRLNYDHGVMPTLRTMLLKSAALGGRVRVVHVSILVDLSHFLHFLSPPDLVRKISSHSQIS